MIQTLVLPQLVNRAAWTLMHFLWEGALIAAITAGILHLLSRRSWQAPGKTSCASPSWRTPRMR